MVVPSLLLAAHGYARLCLRVLLFVGGDLEYADEVTLGRAFEGRLHVGVGA